MVISMILFLFCEGRFYHCLNYGALSQLLFSSMKEEKESLIEFLHPKHMKIAIDVLLSTIRSSSTTYETKQAIVSEMSTKLLKVDKGTTAVDNHFFILQLQQRLDIIENLC